MKDIKDELSVNDCNEGEGSKKGVISQMFATAKKQLRIPITKPEVYKPLLLILTITCLQHFSGFTFTKKFLLQVLAPAEKDGVGVSVEKEEEYTGYYFAILINAIRTAANLMMSGFLKWSQNFALKKIETIILNLTGSVCVFFSVSPSSLQPSALAFLAASFHLAPFMTLSPRQLNRGCEWRSSPSTSLPSSLGCRASPGS